MSHQNIVDYIANHIFAPKPKLSIAILASGNGSNLQALIDESKKPESSFVIKAVIANNPSSYALVRAQKADVKNYLVNHRTFTHQSLFETSVAEIISLHQADLIVLAGFMRVLSPIFLRQFKNRIINLHPSLLPKHRGIDAINKALLAKDKIAGCTVHLVDEGLDTGPIIAQSFCPIHEDDDLLALKKRIQSLEHRLLPDVVNKIAQAATRAYA